MRASLRGGDVGTGFACDPLTGNCVDTSCLNITCVPPQTGVMGQCVDATTVSSSTNASSGAIGAGSTSGAGGAESSSSGAGGAGVAPGTAARVACGRDGRTRCSLANLL